MSLASMVMSEASSALESGRRIDRYEIVSPIGRAAMGDLGMAGRTINP